MAQLMLSTSFAQVYFHCNYLGDTVVGILFGTSMGVLFNKIGLKLILKGVYKAITGYGTVEDSLYDEDL